jgi:hypothetical protein
MIDPGSCGLNKHLKMPANRPASRETGLEMPCCPASDLLWVQISQCYPNRLRFSSLPCPQSPCHAVIDPVLALRRAKQGTKGGGRRSVPHTLCRLFLTPCADFSRPAEELEYTCLLKSTFTEASHVRGLDEVDFLRVTFKSLKTWMSHLQVSRDLDESLSSLSRIG